MDVAKPPMTLVLPYSLGKLGFDLIKSYSAMITRILSERIQNSIIWWAQSSSFNREYGREDLSGAEMCGEDEVRLTWISQVYVEVLVHNIANMIVKMAYYAPVQMDLRGQFTVVRISLCHNHQKLAACR